LALAPIHSIDDLAKDAHANVRGLHWVDDPVLGTVRFPTPVPVQLAAGQAVGSPASHLGQDTNCVLTSILGYSDTKLAVLADRKVIPVFGARPRLRSTSVSPSIQPVTPAGFTRNEIEARDAAKLEAATDYAALKIANRHGSGEVAAKIQAHVAIA
jgi:hypothetical protein